MRRPTEVWNGDQCARARKLRPVRERVLSDSGTPLDVEELLDACDDVGEEGRSYWSPNERRPTLSRSAFIARLKALLRNCPDDLTVRDLRDAL